MIMKKIFTIIACALSLMTFASCDWFELDNQEGYNASVYGTILDKSGQPVYQEQGGGFNIYEKVSGGQAYIGRDWNQETSQSWSMKANGTYVNRLVFAGDYYMKSLNANFVADSQDFKLNKGENKVDFTVTPYCRIDNVSISVSGNKIIATCKVSSDLPEATVNNVGEVRLCCYQDRFVGNGKNNCRSDAGSIKTNIDPKGGQTVTLEIDKTNGANSYEFQYDRPHYVRVAALAAHYSIVPEWTEVTYEQDWSSPLIDWDAIIASGFSDLSSVPVVEIKTFHPAEYKNDGASNTSNKYNYSAVYKIDTNGNVTEVTDWGDIK